MCHTAPFHPLLAFLLLVGCSKDVPTSSYEISGAFSGSGDCESSERWVLEDDGNGVIYTYGSCEFASPIGAFSAQLTLGTPEADEWSGVLGASDDDLGVAGCALASGVDGSTDELFVAAEADAEGTARCSLGASDETLIAATPGASCSFEGTRAKGSGTTFDYLGSGRFVCTNLTGIDISGNEPGSPTGSAVDVTISWSE